MSIKRTWYNGILILILVLACGHIDPRRMRTINQRKAERIVGLLCLPKNLPATLNPTPEFYWVGDDIDLPDAGIVYRGQNNSPHLIYILASSHSRTYLIQDEYIQEFYDPPHCKDRFTITSSYFYPICKTTSVPPLYDYEKKILVVDPPPFVTNFVWLANKGEDWAFYRIRSTLSAEETKQIVASMCAE